MSCIGSTLESCTASSCHQFFTSFLYPTPIWNSSLTFMIQAFLRFIGHLFCGIIFSFGYSDIFFTIRLKQHRKEAVCFSFHPIKWQSIPTIATNFAFILWLRWYLPGLSTETLFFNALYLKSVSHELNKPFSTAQW